MSYISKILWSDASGITHLQKEWMTVEEAIEQAKLEFKNKVCSMGYIIHRNKDFIIIAATKTREGKDAIYSDISMIPTCLIVKK